MGEVMHAIRSRRLPVRSMHLRCLSCVAAEMVNSQRGQPSHIDTPYHPIKCLAQAEHVAPRTRNPGACVLQLRRNKASRAMATAHTAGCRPRFQNTGVSSVKNNYLAGSINSDVAWLDVQVQHTSFVPRLHSLTTTTQASSQPASHHASRPLHRGALNTGAPGIDPGTASARSQCERQTRAGRVPAPAHRRRRRVPDVPTA